MASRVTQTARDSDCRDSNSLPVGLPQYGCKKTEDGRNNGWNRPCPEAVVQERDAKDDGEHVEEAVVAREHDKCLQTDLKAQGTGQHRVR